MVANRRTANSATWRWVLSLFTLIAGCEEPGGALDRGNAEPVKESRFRGKIVLGSPSLTSGIPGKGPLSIDDIRPWLADPKNHEPLDFSLPLGLDEGAAMVHVPDGNPLTRAKIELGRQLFFDIRLAGKGRMSCSDCHHPTHGYSRWIVMPEVERNALVAFNRIFSRRQFWDGRAEELEDQVQDPLQNKFEMNGTIEGATQQIAAIAGYRLQFERIFGGVTFAAITQALGCFERALVTGPAPYDFQRAWDRFEGVDPATLADHEREVYDLARAGIAAHPMSPAARRGQTLFFSERVGCAICHSGPNFTDEQYYNLGLAARVEGYVDLGRQRVTKQAPDRGAFKTPTLRNVADTPPYMHAGQFESLEQVIDWFDRPQTADPDHNPLIRPLGLSPEEKQDLVEFLRALTGPLPPVEIGRLPE